MDPVARLRELCFTESSTFGCAEGTYAALQGHFGLANETDSAEAMALNGGIGYSGGTCGALGGAALSLGRLAAARISDRPTAKRAARGILQALMAEFEQLHGSTDCRDLTGFDLKVDHDAFMESGAWETGCRAQIEFVLRRLEPLTSDAAWNDAVADLGLETSDPGPAVG